MDVTDPLGPLDDLVERLVVDVGLDVDREVDGRQVVVLVEFGARVDLNLPEVVVAPLLAAAGLVTTERKKN